jgi:hypothetical protein
LTTSYDRIAWIEGTTVVVHSHRSDFNRPVITGVRDQIVDRTHGLLFTSPITLLAMVGLISLARRRGGLALYLVITFLSIFVFFARYDYWNASHYGSRFLLPIMVLATIPLAALLDRYVAGRLSNAAEDQGGPNVNRPTTSSQTMPSTNRTS